MMPPWTVWLSLALLLAVVGWGLASWRHEDVLTARERVVLDALARIARRRQ